MDRTDGNLLDPPEDVLVLQLHRRRVPHNRTQRLYTFRRNVDDGLCLVGVDEFEAVDDNERREGGEGRDVELDLTRRGQQSSVSITAAVLQASGPVVTRRRAWVGRTYLDVLCS